LSTDNLQPNVQGAVEAYYRDFERLHITFGDALAYLCYQSLSRDSQNSSSTQFRDSFDSYLESVVAFSVRRVADKPRWTGGEDDGHFEEIPASPTIFDELVEIGVKHEADGIASAKAWMLDMVRRIRPRVRDWPSLACNNQMMNPSWRAPRFLLMEPVGPEPYNPKRAHERLDEAGTANVLDYLADEFERRFTDALEDGVLQQLPCR